MMLVPTLHKPFTSRSIGIAKAFNPFAIDKAVQFVRPLLKRLCPILSILRTFSLACNSFYSTNLSSLDGLLKSTPIKEEQKQDGDVLVEGLPYILHGDVLANSVDVLGKLRSAAVIVTAGASLFWGYSLVDGNERFYREVAMPCIQLLNAETAHRFGVWTASMGLVPRNKYIDPPSLRTEVWGLTFQNPVGLAAGFDKHAEAIDGLLKIGFGFVEVGSVTPEPQPGNPKPRVFRLSEDHGVINRYGFNSEGHVAALKRLKARMYHKTNHPEDHQGIVGINFGKNKTSPDSVGDYTKGIRNLGCFGDYLVVNVSSPNTPGLRDMQGKKKLADLIEKVLEARNSLPVDPKPPLLVKIAPDLTEQDKIDIASVVLTPQSRVDGLIVSNTTISRPTSLKSENKKEGGGLSGEPLKALSTETIGDMYKLTKGSIPIVGVGGISSGKDAYEKIRAGASLIQLYTALSYQGPPLITRIKRELVNELQKGGFDNVQAAVGADHR